MTGTAAEWEQYTFSQQLEKEFGVNDANMRTVEFPSYAPIATQDIKGASPSGKAAGFDPAMRWFESSRPCHFLILIQVTLSL